MVLHAIFGADKDGVIPPDHAVFADAAGQRLKCADTVHLRRQAGLSVLAVGVQRELEVVGIRVHRIEFAEHGRGVLGPEHDAVHRGGREIDAADLTGVHWIAHERIALFEPAEEPAGVKGGDVGSSAGADDHLICL